MTWISFLTIGVAFPRQYLKRKSLIEDNIGRTQEKYFHNDKNATNEHYKANIEMVKDQIKAKDARHFMELEANSILAHIELIEELEKGSFNLKSKKKKLEAKLLLAKEELS